MIGEDVMKMERETAMYFKYKDLAEFEKAYNDPVTMRQITGADCSCGARREMKLETVTVDIGNYHIEVVDCPIMGCNNCGRKCLCPDIPQELYRAYFQLEKRNQNACRITMKGDHRFEWAEDADYKYDSRDLSIPGLGIDLDPTHPEGFSCPVFFDRKVLGIFYNDSDYELDFFSESYGTIAEKGTCGYQYEWNIPFGNNENDKVILFLGDLDEIDKDDRAVLWLKSYNIPSDHCIVDTELYQAQLNCVFSEPIIEKRIISLRNLFYQRVKNIYGIDLFHLENECESSANRIRKPLNYSESELRENMILLDGLLNEGISGDGLRSLYKKLNGTLPNNSTQTRKLLQGIIACVEDEEKAKKIIGPLYSLNDLRICFAHLLPQENIEQRKQNILSTFGLTDFQDYRRLYDTALERLYELYKYLNVMELPAAQQ